MHIKELVLSMAVLSAGVASAGEWRDDLWLGRGALWTNRVAITVSNGTGEDWNGRTVAVSASRLPLGSARVEELRLVDSRGVQLECGVADASGAFVETGTVPADGSVAVPVVCPAGGKATYELYYGNASAWGLADRWNRRPDAEGTVEIGESESLSFRTPGEDATWTEGEWLWRVPVRVANLGGEPLENSLGAIMLAEASRSTPNPVCRVEFEGREVESFSLGNRLFFRCELPPRSVGTFYVYVRTGGERAPVAPPKSALGSAIPSDQVVVRDLVVGNEDVFARILESPVNLLKNGSFEEGREPWWGAGKPDVKFEIAETGGRFGKSFAKMEIPADSPLEWNGWRQTVWVKPGHTYFYGAFMSAENLTSKSYIHGHLNKMDGKPAFEHMQRTLTGVVGTTAWTASFATIRATENAAQLYYQLTTDGKGVLAHDGALVAEYREGLIGAPELPAAQTKSAGVLDVEQVSSIVKVFPETPVHPKKDAKTGVALARNETETLQLAVRSSKGGKVELDVVVKNAPKGLAFKTGRVDLVPVDWPSAYFTCETPDWELRYPRLTAQCDGWSGWWPDPVAPESSADLKAGETRAFRVDVSADSTVAAGVYRGELVWKLGGREVRRDPFAVRVWNFEIPARPEFTALFDVRLTHHWNPLGATEQARRERVWKFMAEKKACPESIGVNLEFKRAADGAVTCDFTEYDRAAALYFDTYRFPVSYAPGCFYSFGWANPPAAFLGENPYPGDWPYNGADRSVLRPEFKAAYQAAVKLYWNHLRENGWDKKVLLYISDEPYHTFGDVQKQMKALCAMIHEADPEVRIYSSTWVHSPNWDDSLDVWGVGHYGCFPLEDMAALKAKGSRIWWTTDGQMCLDTPFCAIERLLPLYAHKYGADAYEFWGSTWLTYDPWKIGWHAYNRQSDQPGVTQWARYPAGDGFLIYPPRHGKDEGPVTSVRMDAVRDGVEDHAYLALLAEKAKKDGEAAKLLKEFESLVSFPSAGGRYSTEILPDPRRYEALRRKAGRLLDGSAPATAGRRRE